MEVDILLILMRPSYFIKVDVAILFTLRSGKGEHLNNPPVYVYIYIHMSL